MFILFPYFMGYECSGSLKRIIQLELSKLIANNDRVVAHTKDETQDMPNHG